MKDQAEVEHYASLYGVPLPNEERWYKNGKKRDSFLIRSGTDFKSPGMASRILSNISEDRSIGGSKVNFDSIIPIGVKAPRRQLYLGLVQVYGNFYK